MTVVCFALEPSAVQSNESFYKEAPCHSCTTASGQRLVKLKHCGCTLCIACLDKRIAAAVSAMQLEDVLDSVCCPACDAEVLCKDLVDIHGHRRFEELEWHLYNILRRHTGWRWPSCGAKRLIPVGRLSIRVISALQDIEDFSSSHTGDAGSPVQELRQSTGSVGRFSAAPRSSCPLEAVERSFGELRMAVAKSRNSYYLVGGTAELILGTVACCGRLNAVLRTWLARAWCILKHGMTAHCVDYAVLEFIMELSASRVLLPVLLRRCTAFRLPLVNAKHQQETEAVLKHQRSPYRELNLLRELALQDPSSRTPGVCLENSQEYGRALISTAEALDHVVGDCKSFKLPTPFQLVSSALNPYPDHCTEDRTACSHSDAIMQRKVEKGEVVTGNEHWCLNETHLDATGEGMIKQTLCFSDCETLSEWPSLPNQENDTFTCTPRNSDSAIGTEKFHAGVDAEDSFCDELQQGIQRSIETYIEENGICDPSKGMDVLGLVGRKLPISHLIETRTYICSKQRLLAVKAEYPMWRKIKGDGNCFYRAFLFGLLEALIDCHDCCAARALARQIERLIEHLNMSESRNDGPWYGGARMLIDMLNLIADCEISVEQLEINLCEVDVSNPMIQFLRIATSWEMRISMHRYAEIVSACTREADASHSEHGEEPQEEEQKTELLKYCLGNVEMMSMEADQCEIVALSDCLGVPVKVESIAGDAYHCCHDGAGADTGAPTLHLLFLPGHYDLIYPAQA
uniref:ubiquitinyl hydrolase 1 n=1 Tax=Tetraselmis sp. GSL018 TaxID=582737 RepID=A0A061SNS6_9CHLO